MTSERAAPCWSSGLRIGKVHRKINKIRHCFTSISSMSNCIGRQAGLSADVRNLTMFDLHYEIKTKSGDSPPKKHHSPCLIEMLSRIFRGEIKKWDWNDFGIRVRNVHAPSPNRCLLMEPGMPAGPRSVWTFAVGVCGDVPGTLVAESHDQSGASDWCGKTRFSCGLIWGGYGKSLWCAASAKHDDEEDDDHWSWFIVMIMIIYIALPTLRILLRIL